MFRVEFGKHESGKWVPEQVRELASFDLAKHELSLISDELKKDEGVVRQVKMFGPDDHLYHYITSVYPNISLPSYERK